MPRPRRPQTEAEKNGQSTGRSKPGKLAALLEARRGATDEMKIGTPRFTAGDEDETGSWAELAESVSGVKWLVPRWVPFGMLTGVIAEPKSGKSAFALWALIRPVVTGGVKWFNESRGPAEPGYVVFCDTERSAAVNIERMKNWGLPMGRILTPFKDDPFKVIDIDNPEHIDRILNVVCKYKALLVVVDSYRGAHKGDENKSTISTGLQNLGGVCEETGAACVVIHHAKKMSIGEDMTINAGRGSNAFLAAVRVQLGIDIPDPRPDRVRAWRRVQMLGENLGTAPPAVGFCFADVGLQFGPAPTRPEKQVKETGMDRAEAWLRTSMKPGEWCEAKALEAEAEALGFVTTGTLQRAREALGVVRPDNVRKVGKGWQWRLPLPSPVPEGKKSPGRPKTAD